MSDDDMHDGAERTPVSIRTARSDDPHFGDLAKHPVRTERLIALVLLVGIAGVAGFGAVFWLNGNKLLLAVTFGVGLLALGFGLTAWGKYLMPQGPFVEERHVLASSEEEREAMAAALVERSGIVVKRRRMLGGLFAGGMGIFGIVAAFPLLRSLGPQPGNLYETTDWKKGVYLVDRTGRRVHKNDLEYTAGSLFVFPEKKNKTDTGQSVDQVVLIRITVTAVTPKLLVKSRTSWRPEGFFAYSKVCTHLGCPVNLYERELRKLVCPCHQSMFTVVDGAKPIFGPAPRPLPQLPLAIDADGYLVAATKFNQAVGPGFWERTDKGNAGV